MVLKANIPVPVEDGQQTHFTKSCDCDVLRRVEKEEKNKIHGSIIKIKGRKNCVNSY